MNDAHIKQLMDEMAAQNAIMQAPPPAVLMQPTQYVNPAIQPQQQGAGMPPVGMASMMSGMGGGGAAAVPAGGGFTGSAVHSGVGMGSGAGAGGGAGGAGGALAAAGPWAALAALIVGNEMYAKDRGYRREGSDYWKDLGTGKVLWQDIEHRWSPKLFGNSTIGKDHEGLAQIMQGNISEGWGTIKDHGVLSKILDIF